MKQVLLIVVLLCSTMTFAFGQIEFESGYVVDLEGNKTLCAIKNEDWRNNPKEILIDKEGTQKVSIDSISGFGFINGVQYECFSTKIDRSSAVISKLSKDRQPIFTDERLALRVIVSGVAKLYKYQDNNLVRFYYASEGNDLKPLVYKKYLDKYDKIFENNAFRQDLWSNLSIEGVERSYVAGLKYSEKSLMKYFQKYNRQFAPSAVEEHKEEKREVYNLSLRPRVDFHSFSTFEYPNTQLKENKFSDQVNFSFGVDNELFLRSNKGKWSGIVGLYYRYYQGDYTYETGGGTFNKSLKWNMKYAAIDIPLGVRYYSYLNSDARLYADASFTVSFNSGGSLIPESTSYTDEFKMANSYNFSLGLGYSYKGRADIQVRYDLPRNAIVEGPNSSLNTFSVVLGYRIIKVEK